METSQKKYLRLSSHSLLMVGLVSGLLALAACQPVRDPAVIAAQQTAIASGTSVPAEGTPEPTALSGVEAPTVTISASALRVHTAPSDDSEKIVSVKEGETYSVTGISSNGEWIQIAIDGAPDGKGWVSAEFVTLTGDITDIQVVDAATPEATEEATEEATAEPTEEATEEATEETTVEATEEATVEPTEEATEEATVEPTEEATEEATVEVTEEATVEPTEEATEEATPEATTAVAETATVTATEEATVEPTAEATEEATPEATAAVTETATVTATEEATAEPTATATSEVTTTVTPTPVPGTPDLGTVTITTDLPLRVRSAPTTAEDNKIGSVYNDETYTVLEVSDDGLWVRIETPQFPEGSGWVSAEYVVYNEAK